MPNFFDLIIICSAIFPLPLAIIKGALDSPTSYFKATAKCVGFVIIAVASDKFSTDAFSLAAFEAA